ncbi:translation initiation factor IF-2, mitochondrial-like [Lineus longissimus]|uniref:translation initiation factor IF-2, mitochondrial-like n=1 Tax=Lineus longissimus TaxID=88925 RepID=UPI002B4D844A
MQCRSFLRPSLQTIISSCSLRWFGDLKCSSKLLSVERCSLLNLRNEKVVPCLFCAFLQQQRLFHVSTSLAAKKKEKKRKPINIRKKGRHKAATGEVLNIRPNMTIQQVADLMSRDTDDVFEALFFIPNTNQYDRPDTVIDKIDVIKEILKKCGYRNQIKIPKSVIIEENLDAVRQPPPADDVLVSRPPVVTIMGHVDHGKTTLLDALRKTNVVDQEFGGITQHIGAFSVVLPNNKEKITFLDTPGHAAFSAMRARGAYATDIVVLVIAVDDGVMAQSIESIQHAKDSGVPVIVALNKIDKAGQNVEEAKKQLMEHGIQLEDFGGDVQAVPVSALKGTNLVELQEAIVTLAELSDLKADPTGLVEGLVIESKTDPGRGKLATVLIQRGVLRKGDYLVTGTAWAKVRGMFNDSGKPIQEAPPSTPVEIIGWREQPSAGDEILQVETEQRAREIVKWRQDKLMDKKMDEAQVVIDQNREQHQAVYQDQRKARLQAGLFRKRRREYAKTKEEVNTKEGPELAMVLKGDVDGSVEAILDTLDSYQSSKCRLDIISYGVGNVTENDIDLAASFNGIVYGFNVKVPEVVKKIAASKSVPVKCHNVIYRLFDDLRTSLTGRLPLQKVDEVLGEADVKQIFEVKDGKKKVLVGGCRCTKGVLQRKEKFKVVRNGEVVHEGSLLSLKHFKNEVDSIKLDVECGLSFSDKSIAIQPGDTIVCYTIKEVEQTIDWDLDF